MKKVLIQLASKIGKNIKMQLPEYLGTEILRCTVGSTLYGTGQPDSQDIDQMGIYLQKPRHLIGLDMKEHFNFRTAKKNQPSEAGDLDLVCYSLRKWVKLALSGNPSVIQVLWAPDEMILNINEIGIELRKLAPEWVASKKVGLSFLGYLHQQKAKMLTRNRFMDTDYDGKYALHMLRLGYQGLDYMNTGRLQFPMDPVDITYLQGVRHNLVKLDEVIGEAEYLEDLINQQIATSSLPSEPNRIELEQWLIRTQLEYWRDNGN